MSEKEPVLLTTLIDTSRMRWLVGAIGFDGEIYPLVRSQDNDLSSYRNLEFDEQASFLRHRFCGVLQRGCDRVWGLKKKAAHFVFVLDQPFPDAAPELTERTAEHLFEWMANPPVTFLIAKNTFESTDVKLKPIAGTLDERSMSVFESSLAKLGNAANDDDRWEESPKPRS